MRKRGKPNPDQKYDYCQHVDMTNILYIVSFRYFALVVAIHAYTASYDYPVVAYVSERIIVRVRQCNSILFCLSGY